MTWAQLSGINEGAKKLLQMPSEPSHHLQRQVQEDLEKLQRMAQRIQATLNDAEKREIRDDRVKHWLRELKGVADHAEYVLDEYDYELIRAKVEAGSSQAHHEATFSIPLDASFCAQMAVKIREIRERFEEISSYRKALNLKEGDDEQGYSQVMNSRHRPPSSHIVDAPQIYGRTDELEKVINLLLYSEECKKSNLSVLPIVGMGGVGKTTLVQHVYNDQRMSQHFQMRGWVCVSDACRVEKLTAGIIESLTMEECHLKELSALQKKLEGLLKGKLFLLVLDDVWNENRTLWESLRKPLTSGAQGSVVVTTTRSQSIAKMMQTVSFHRLECLSVDDCWEVFRQSAFGDRDPNDMHPDLKEVGMKIVKKCGCLPLAAKSLGGFLSYETEVAAWEGVLQCDIWDLHDDNSEVIFPALMLSYLHLPNHLKQCFLYASIFPKDFRFKKDDMIRMWMAQGLLKGRNRNQGADDFGNQCFEELLQRSFLQYAVNAFSIFFSVADGEYNCFVMHDLIHDLARRISGGEFFHIDGDKAPLSHLDEVRHVFVKGQEVVDLEKMLQIRCSTIRTLVIMYESKMVKFPSQMMPPLKFLRALTLTALFIDELPDSIGDLMHLRYLSLDFSRIRRLPDSICKLYNLQTLSLAQCWNLERLPKDVKNLCNLQHLNIKRTHFPFLPSGFGKLTSLRMLDEFNLVRNTRQIPFVYDEGCSKTKEEVNDLPLQQSNNNYEETSGGIEVLKDLIHLTGRLNVLGLQQVMDAEDAKLADLRNKRNIKELSLCWRINSEASPAVQTEVLENLQPPDRLQVLQIRDYSGLRFPSWMGSGGDLMPSSWSSSLSRLVRVVIECCDHCTSLPPLGQLDGLKYLEIRGMGKVEVVGSEFYGGPVNNLVFPMLEELIFADMQNWVTWDHAVVAGTGGALLPRLRCLRMIDCYKLKSMVPLHLLQALEELEVVGMHNWLTWDHAVVAWTGGALLPRLRRLCMVDCSKLKSMVPLHLLQALEELEVQDCPELETIELAGRCLISSIGGGPRMPALKKMAIDGCPRARFSPGDDGDLFFRLPPTLGVLTIRNSPVLVGWCTRGKLAYIPNARFWRTRDGGEKILSTLGPKTQRWREKITVRRPLRDLLIGNIKAFGKVIPKVTDDDFRMLQQDSIFGPVIEGLFDLCLHVTKWTQKNKRRR